MKIKKGDNIIVLTGKDKGKKAKVVRAFPAENKVLVEGVNMKKKRQRPRKSNEKGQTIEKPLPIPAGNVAIFCSTCGKGVRIGAKITGGKKTRICVKCKREF